VQNATGPEQAMCLQLSLMVRAKFLLLCTNPCTFWSQPTVAPFYTRTQLETLLQMQDILQLQLQKCFELRSCIEQSHGWLRS